MTKLVLVRVDKQQPSLEPKYTGPFRVLRRWGKCFRLRLENRDDNVSVDRLRPFYEEDTGRRSQTEQTTNNADIGSAIAEKENKPVNDPEQLPTLGRRAARRGQGGRLTTLNFRPGAVTTLNLGHVSIFYKVIFPVHKQGSIESPPRKQRLENDAKEREKQTIVAQKPVSKPNNASSDRRSLQNIRRSFIRCGADSLDGNAPMFPGTYVPRYPCSPVPMFPGTCLPRTYMFPGTYVPRSLCSPICG